MSWRSLVYRMVITVGDVFLSLLTHSSLVLFLMIKHSGEICQYYYGTLLHVRTISIYQKMKINKFSFPDLLHINTDDWWIIQ